MPDARSPVRRRKAGKFGQGAYADEPWSLQSFQKRVYAVRDFYGIELKGTMLDNPGWHDAVCGVLGALARLIGKKPLHVPQVSGCMRASARKKGTPRKKVSRAGRAGKNRPTARAKKIRRPD